MLDGSSSLPDNPREKSDTELVNELNRIAPLSDKSAEQLVQEGWKEFYSYREYENNGGVNRGDIEYALRAIQREIPQSLNDWEVCRAKMEQFKNHKMEYDRLRALLKRETEERKAWEKSRESR